MSEHAHLPDRLIPVRDAFSLLGMKVTKGYEEINAGRIKVVRNGSRTFVRASEVDRYIAALEAASATEAA